MFKLNRLKVLNRVTNIGIVMLIMAVLILFSNIPRAEIRNATNYPEKLTFAFGRARDDPVTKWLTLIYTDALRRLDIQFVLVDVPSNRGALLANKGVIDGQLSRVEDFDTIYPNMVRVDEHNYYASWKAYATKQLPKLEGWDSLRKRDFSVSFRRGSKRPAEKLMQIIHSNLLFQVESTALGIKTLCVGRVSIYIDIEDRVARFLKSKEFLEWNESLPGENKIYDVGNMENSYSHTWLHKSHRDLAPRIAEIIRNMKEEGLFETYRNRVGLGVEEVKW